MKILIVTPFTEPEKGACVVRVNSFKQFFEKKGFFVEIIAPQRKNISSIGRYSSIYDMMFKIIKAKPKIVIGTSPPLPHNFFAFIAAKIIGAKFILDAKDDGYFFETKKGILKRIKHIIYSLLRFFTYKLCDLSIYLTKEDMELEIKRYGLKRVFLVPNGTVDYIKFDKKLRLKFRKLLDFTSFDKIALYSGSIGDEDIEGMLKNSPKKQKYLFLLTSSVDGSGEIQRNLVYNWLNKYSPKSKAFFDLLGSELSGYMSAADFAVLPWTKNMPTSIPVKLFDYISIGLPVVTKGFSSTALERFHKENNIGVFTTTWIDFFSSFKKAHNLNIDSALTGRFKRTFYLNSFYQKLKSKRWVK